MTPGSNQSEHRDSPDPGSRAREIAAYLDGTLAPAALPDFCDWLNASDDNARQLVEQMLLESHLRRPASAQPHADAKPTPGEASGTRPISAAGAPIYRKGHEPKPTRIHPAYYAITAVAAALLAACGVAIYLLAFNTPTAPDPTPSQPGPPVATLIQNTGNLTTPHGYPAEGDDFSAGEYTLTSGGAEFMLTNAVNVKLRGETRMHMRGDMNVTLSRGSAAFVVPNRAKGFTVHLPGGSRVVDLGTEFVVRVDSDGRADVFVTKGSVRIESAAGESHTLAAGAGRAVGASGELTSVDLAPLAEAYPEIDIDGIKIDVPDGSFEDVAVAESLNAHSAHWKSDWEPGPLFDPSDKEFPGTTGGDEDAGPGGTNTDDVLPDGGQIAFIYSGSFLSQTLEHAVEAGETYRLRFAIGRWQSDTDAGPFGRYRVQLLAGDESIIDVTSDQINDGRTPAVGTFDDVSLVGTASSGATGPLRIVFTSLEDPSINFIDHVVLHRLHANPEDASGHTSNPPAPIGAQP